MRYRFIGGKVEMGATKLSQFGQSVTLDDKTAFQLLSADVPVPMLPDAVFSEIGFTPDELRDFAAPLSRGPEGTPAIRRRFHKGGVTDESTKQLSAYLQGFERKKREASEVFLKIHQAAKDAKKNKVPFDPANFGRRTNPNPEKPRTKE